MKKSITSNCRPLLRVLSASLVTIAALWAMPRNAHAQLYVTQYPTGVVSKYNAETGAVINPNFISALNGPSALLISGNELFVAIENGNTVAKYDAGSGNSISVIPGLNGPAGLALQRPTAVFPQPVLFVANSGNDTVGKYAANTGAVINASFILSSHEPAGLVVSANKLFVANFDNDTVGEYNATTGAVIKASFIKGLHQPAAIVVFRKKLFVANYGSGTVGKYNVSNGAVNNGRFITGLNGPNALAVSGTELFVANAGGGTVGEYSIETGAPINVNFITGLLTPTGLAVKSE
jgi:outer membrane protein assembly factor BamB